MPYLSSQALKSCTRSRATIISSSLIPSIFKHNLLFVHASILVQELMETIYFRKQLIYNEFLNANLYPGNARPK